MVTIGICILLKQLNEYNMIIIVSFNILINLSIGLVSINIPHLFLSITSWLAHEFQFKVFSFFAFSTKNSRLVLQRPISYGRGECDPATLSPCQVCEKSFGYLMFINILN